MGSLTGQVSVAVPLTSDELTVKSLQPFTFRINFRSPTWFGIRKSTLASEVHCSCFILLGFVKLIVSPFPFPLPLPHTLPLPLPPPFPFPPPPTRNEILVSLGFFLILRLKENFTRYKIKHNNKISHEYSPNECASVFLELNFEKLLCLKFKYIESYHSVLKGADHLTVTWKVDEGVYQHVDVREEGKENAFSLGRSLWIDSEVRKKTQLSRKALFVMYSKLQTRKPNSSIVTNLTAVNSCLYLRMLLHF